MKNAVTEKLIASVKKKVKPPPERDEIAFLRNFHHRLSGQDFTPRRALAFRDAALRHRQLGEVRAPGKTLIEIYNLPEDPNDPGKSVADQDVTIIQIITDDKPFLIDSLTIKLNAMRKTPQRTTHPNFVVRRDHRHRMEAMTRYQGSREEARGDGVVECYVQIVIDFTPESEHKLLRQELRSVLSELEIVVKDWRAMRRRTLALAEQVEARKQDSGFAEHGELLRWMEHHNFAFLGYAEVEIAESTENTENTDGRRETIDEKSLLGVLRAAHRQGGTAAAHAILPPLAHGQRAPVVFTKSRRRSAIHRADYLDCILIDHAASHAENNGGRRKISCILGLLARSSAMLPTAAIPHLRNKTAYILAESTLRPGGHGYKTLQSILETLPREKLFQMDTRSLYALCMTLLNHLERRKTRLHLHRNICGHFYSCLVYIPRDLFNSTLRERIQAFLGDQLGADEVSFNVYFSDSILTRIHYLIHCGERSHNIVDPEKLECIVQVMARDWNDNLHESIRQLHGHERANRTLARYRDAFPGSYRDEFSIEQAIIDIDLLEQVEPKWMHAALSYRPRADSVNHRIASFKLYSQHKPIVLSDALPILENMGIRVLGGRPYRINRRDDDTTITLWLYDFEIARHDDRPFDIAAVAENFQATFIQAWRGGIENDGFNRLTLLAGLNWKEVSLLRAYYRYLKQIRLRYSEHYIIEALANNPDLVVSIIDYIHSRFDPKRTSAGSGNRRIKAAIKRQLDQVATLDEDRIIRALLDVINATLRSNYYQLAKSGDDKPYLAFKLRAVDIPRIPQPAPQYEIFVCSPRMEGVHLRGGQVARGGLRWSERAEDFRTEVLGLVKAQRVKNAVIVPVGSKGGFVAKRLPEADRDAIQREVIACYRLFISGLLDLTDNLSGDRVIPPREVTRIDGDDPYLVVAADKGTATFSDIANGISADYGFWLGDAFASGGSAGYDHKKMGITARGAWESVKRHFRELGKDIQSTDFTVVGIGDMAGDVFGNGMLLSEHIRLIAAFNHQHIFIDPTPDAAASYAERRRLFALPRSSWADYRRELLSAGGDIFERSAKSITLSPQAKKALNASRDKYAPDDLINLILKSEVELLWNGGIGTYIKATSESHAAVQDKNNDGVRVNAAQLRCKVIGEGGNLGMTQLARVEYALGGGLCYTDAIDNSAGVDTSDHEVNIKILLNAAIESKLLASGQRNALLAKMQDQVGALVLRNNYAQTQTLSLEAVRSRRLMPQQCRAIDMLEQQGLLNRDIEFLPSNAALEERREEGKWLTRPELAVLLSYSKMQLYQALLDSDVPDDPYIAREIERYFPPLLAKKYPDQVRTHRLRREIISTQITNDLVGVMGSNFHLRLTALTGCHPAEITRAYLAARDILDTSTTNAAVESLDNQVAAPVQLAMLEQISEAMRLCVEWLLSNQPGRLDIRAQIAANRPGCGKLAAILNDTLGRISRAALAKQARKLAADGVPPALAERIAALPYLGHAIDIVAIAAQRKRSVAHAAAVHFHIRESLGLHWIEQAIDALPASNDWHERARFRLGSDLRAGHAAITATVLAGGGRANTAAMLERWLQANRQPVCAFEKMAATLKTEHAPDFAMLSVLLGELAGLH